MRITTVSQACIDLVKEFESVELTAYLCPAGIWTVGYGHTGEDVHPGLTITQDEAESLLRRDIRTFEHAVAALTADVPLEQHQFDALVSLTFNIGQGNFRSSTLLRKLKAQDYEGARAEFLRWNKSKGKELTGLTRRRKAEAQLFGG